MRHVGDAAPADGYCDGIAPTDTDPALTSTRASRTADDDVLPQPAEVPRGSRRDRIRSKPGLAQAYRAGVFLAGSLCIVLGLALAVLPGPLTIPPVLLGLYIWSTEFAFAERLFQSFKRKARKAWEHARRHPRSSAAVTVGGLAAAGVAMWAVVHYALIENAKQAVGL